MVDDLTLVSWGGAYQNSQVKAYAEPYMEMNPEVTITWDESSNEAWREAARHERGGQHHLGPRRRGGRRRHPPLRRGAGDGDRFRRDARARPDGTPATEDFGDLIVSDCYIPQIVFSTTFGYRTDVEAWGGRRPRTSAPSSISRTSPASAASSVARSNLEWALLCDGVAKEDLYDVLSTEEGVDRALAKLDTIKDEVIWWSAGADTPQLLADGEVVMGSTYNGRLFSLIEEQDQPVAMLWDCAGLRPRRLDHPRRSARGASEPRARLPATSRPTRSGWPTRPSTSPTARPAPPRSRSSRPMPTLGIEMAPHMPTNPANAELPA
jgi:putative spermidine/putrescine transport system substrate-binding protein